MAFTLCYTLDNPNTPDDNPNNEIPQTYTVSGYSVSRTEDGWGNPAAYVDDVYTLSNETTNFGENISLPVYINSHGTHALAWMERCLG